MDLPTCYTLITTATTPRSNTFFCTQLLVNLLNGHIYNILFSPISTHHHRLSLPQLSNLKSPQQPLHRHPHILNNDRHLLPALLPPDHHQGEILIHLPQQDGSPAIRQHNDALGILARDLILELLVPRRSFEIVHVRLRSGPSVDLRDVDDDVDVVAADLVRGHVDG